MTDSLISEVDDLVLRQVRGFLRECTSTRKSFIDPNGSAVYFFLWLLENKFTIQFKPEIDL